MMTVLSFTSCEKDLMDYQGGEVLYFDVRTGAAWLDPSTWAHQFHTPVMFGATSANELPVRLHIRTTGTAKNYDRPFRVVVVADSTTAKVGKEYSGINEECVIKAGELDTYFEFTAHRTADILEDTVRLQLRIEPGKDFTTRFENYQEENTYYQVTFPDKVLDRNHSASIHNVYIYDTMVMPTGWWGTDAGGLFGPFSAAKIRLMMKVCNLTIDDFADKKMMPQARAQVVSTQFTNYLLEQADQHTPCLEKNGTMMWTMYVNTLGGTRKWNIGTTPEQYYNK